MSWLKLIARAEPVLNIIALAPAILPYAAAAVDAVPLRPSLQWLPRLTAVLCVAAAFTGLWFGARHAESLSKSGVRSLRRTLRYIFLIPAAAAALYFILVTVFTEPLSSLWWDRLLLAFLGLSYVTAFTGFTFATAIVLRDLAARAAWAEQQNAKTMRVLMLAANPMATTRLDLEDEIRSLQEQLGQVKYRDAISFSALLAARPNDLVSSFRKERPNVIHFSGHGEPQGILMRTDNESTVTVTGDALRRFLSDRGIVLVVLNSCYSRHQAVSIQDVVGAVVGTTETVRDDAARRFSAALYRGLGNGLTLAEATRDAGDELSLYDLPDVFHTTGDLELRLTGL